jgi:hypothetical protein
MNRVIWAALSGVLVPSVLLPGVLLLGLVLSGLVLAGGGGPPAALGANLPSPSVGQSASLTALTTDPSGAAVLAWVQQGPAGERSFDQVRAARWNGEQWEALGGVLNENPAHNAAQLTAVRGPDGQPWLGWSEDAGTAHVDSYLISRWNGQAWSDPARYAVRRNLSDAGKSRAFTVTADNQPYLTWTNIYYPGASAGVVQPFTWSAGRWEEHAPPLNHSLQSAAFFPAATRGADGLIYTAWLEGHVAQSNVYVSKQSATGNWTPVGGALNFRPNTYTFAPQLAAGARGVVAAWSEDQAGIDNLFVKRWNGKQWVSLGSSLNQNVRRPAERPNLAVDAAGWPLVAWTEGLEGERRVYAKRWNAQQWVLLGGGPLNTGGHDARSASVTVDGQGRAVVAWCEQSGSGSQNSGSQNDGSQNSGYRVKVKRF